MSKKTKSKKKSGSTKKDSNPSLTGFEDISKHFGITHQKVRVVHMRKPLPQNADGTLKPIKASEFIQHCKGVLRCGELMHMDFAANPDKKNYKNDKKSRTSS